MRKRRFRGLFGLDPARDVDRELSFHLEMQIRDLIDRGESPTRAEAIARRRFGDYERARLESVAINERRRRHMLRADFFSDRVQDIRYALRMCRRAPGFTAAAVLTLALGIGANAAVFALFNRILLRPLPVPEPYQLVNLVSPGMRSGPTSCGAVGGCDSAFSYPMFRDLARVQAVFTGLAAHRDFGVNLGYRGQTMTASGMFVSGDYFTVLGLRPTLGRLLGPDDDRAIDGAEVVVLSHEYWMTQCEGRSDVLNEAVFVNGHAMTVVGVAPPAFEGTTVGLTPQVFVPITMRWRLQPWPGNPPENRRGYWVYLFARLKPGVGVEQARAAIETPYRAILNDVEAPLQEGLSDQALAAFKARSLRLDPGSHGQSSLVADTRAPLTLLLAVTTLVLLIACVNVANLMLARAAARARELATRLSVGATRGRLMAQLLTESCVLASIAAMASLAVAHGTLRLMRSLLPADRFADVPSYLDPSVMIATTVLTLGASVAVGLFPALHASRPGVLSALKAQAGQPAGGHRARRFRVSLATAQVALSMVLVVLAGLFTKSLANISRVDPGLETDGVVTFSLSPQRNGYTLPRATALFERVEEDVASLPGVTTMTSSTTPLLSGDERVTDVFVEGFDVASDADHGTRYDEIGPGYFRALGVPVTAGREFGPADSETAPKVAVINEQFARKFGLEPDAIGKRMSRGTTALDIEIVGVVKDTKHSSLVGAVPPIFFVPHRQSNRRPGLMTFYARTSREADELMPAIRHVLRRLDPNLPVERLQTLQAQMRVAMAPARLMGVMTGAFAVLATLVAAVGLYGLLAYTVAQRTPEIGLRMALGATQGSVRWMVLRQVGLITVVGGAIGIAIAIVVGRAARTLLFGLQFHDAPVIGSAIAVLALATFAAGFLPAHRAAKVDPMRALKHE